MKRVLVTGAYNIGRAGVATIVYKWGQEFPGDKIVYDYLMQRGFPEKKYQDAIKAKGGIIYTRQNKEFGIFGIIKWVERIIHDNQYKIIHINSDSAYIAAAYIFAAKRTEVEKIYVHSHCTKIDDANKFCRLIKTILHYCCVAYVCKNSTMYLACSKLAGDWMFGKKNVNSKKYRTIYNGVEVSHYIYNEKVRNEYRLKLGFDNKMILANIGRLSYQKNQDFLLRLFKKFHVIHPDSVLVLVGEGEFEKRLREVAIQLKVQDFVMFLGRRDDVANLLSAFDVLIMPSRFEGLPVAMVEAQMADLPCVVSNNITKEAKFIESVYYVEGYEYDRWIEAIQGVASKRREPNIDEKEESIFNIKNAVSGLVKILVTD